MELEEQILGQLFKLRGEVGRQTGLMSGIKDHLEDLNGNVETNRKKIAKNGEKIAHQTGLNHIITIVFAGIVSFVVSIFRSQQ